MLTRQRLSRRTFVGSSIGIAVSSLGTSAKCLAQASFPLNTIRVGVIGVGVRGKYLIANLPPPGRVVALCDCSLDRIDSARKPIGEFAEPLSEFARSDARRCSVHQDYRRMLEVERLDAVIIAVPDHHHVRAAILACQAGMDVYCEKPLTLTIGEGRNLVDAVAKHKTILQVGSQQRSMEINRFACEFVRDGGLGSISRVELPNYAGPMSIPDMPIESVPGTLDWNQFCGPAPMRAYNRKLWVKDEFLESKLLWRGWDLFRDYSGHLMTNWGGHSIDMVQYALGTDNTGPTEIWLRPVQDYADQWRAWSDKSPPPDEQRASNENRTRFCPVSMRYSSGVELRFTSDVTEAVFHGEKGIMQISRNKFVADPGTLVKDPPDPSALKKWVGAGHVARPHLANWLECIVSRSTPRAPVEIGHRTATICHLANLARQLGRPLKWNPETERFVGDDDANLMLNRSARAGFEI